MAAISDFRAFSHTMLLFIKNLSKMVVLLLCMILQYFYALDDSNYSGGYSTGIIPF